MTRRYTIGSRLAGGMIGGHNSYGTLYGAIMASRRFVARHKVIEVSRVDIDDDGRSPVEWPTVAKVSRRVLMVKP